MELETDWASTLTVPAAVHAPWPPVGFVEVKTAPSMVIVTHFVAVAQDKAIRLAPSRLTPLDHAPLPPVGFVEVTMSPLSSSATQSVVVGQVSESKNVSSCA